MPFFCLKTATVLHSPQRSGCAVGVEPHEKNLVPIIRNIISGRFYCICGIIHKEAFDFFSGFKMNDRSSVPIKFNPRFDLRLCVFWESPDPFDKCPVKLFMAAFAHIGTPFPVIGDDSFQDPINAQRARQIHKNYGVARFYAHFHRPAEITVKYPRVAL